MTKIYKGNIEKQTIHNNRYRKILFTTNEIQLVVMNIKKYDEIGREKHNGSQFIRIEKGNGSAIIGRKRYRLKSGDILLIPSNTFHNIIAGRKGLKIYTLYSPPQHK